MNIRLPALFALLLSSAIHNAQGEAWELPAALHDGNTTVSFEVDSTFHLVRGKTKGISGTIKQANPTDSLSIEVDLAIPVSGFDTDWGSRDEKLRKVMAAEQFAVVRFHSTRLHESCHPLRVKAQRRCTGALDGILTIRDVSKPVSLPVEVIREGARDRISGTIAIQWAEYHVEDPSILIAKLAPTVTIRYATEVPLR